MYVSIEGIVHLKIVLIFYILHSGFGMSQFVEYLVVIS